MINVFNNINTLSESAAALFVQTAQRSIEAKGRFTVALTGGSSPVQLYKLLASHPYVENVDWTKVFVFWGDERWVPLTDDKSNAKMAYETLLTHVPIPESHIFPMWAVDTTPEAYAKIYEALLIKHLGANSQFDLILLGMGEDGHTASLFPHTAVLKEEKKWVDAYYLEAQQMYRITLTAPLINQAKTIAFITYGKGKAKALHEVLNGPSNPDLYPSQLIQPKDGEVYWFVDEAAAQETTL
ncbi:6-phosphogluconolactonase [Olivibacter sp. XZL3]|uniref:6-phosphogluconolactonase n=1 Tax=Olivibacter sp. XZL3 TaxID=1735116 RepID=UPI001066B7E1|nr:6-phosphogluconolactonase [Olivibacter sp. XZL3]